jgi:cyclohexanecarboxylate-CoA ligase
VLTQRGFWELVEARAATTPNGLLAVDEHDEVLTFGALRGRAETLAAQLVTHGVGPGVRVAWQLPTGLSAIVLVAALARLGATQVPMLPIYREREMRFILRETRPVLYLARTTWRGFDFTAAASELVEVLDLPCAVLAFDAERPASATSAPPAVLPAPPPVDPDVVRWVFYTSGTTADPKGACHSDGTIVAGSAGVATAYAIGEDDRYPIVFPFTHIGGIGMLVIQLLTGCGAVAIEQFSIERTPSVLARHGITIAAGGTPLALAHLAAQRARPDRPLFPALRAVMTGAAPKPPALHAELKTEMGGTGALACYGLTEAPFLTVSDVRDPEDKRALTEGRAISGAVLRVMKVSGGASTPCAPGEVGEIQAQGPQICHGYIDPARRADSFDGAWFRTGDLGWLDADGYLTITGRLKDVIIRKGENISAGEVEDVLYDMVAVAEVAVIGVPDPVLGERCCAVVVPRAGFDPPSLREVVAHCRAGGLAVQKTPEQLELVDALPRNASGKVLKHVLREALHRAATASPSP